MGSGEYAGLNSQGGYENVTLTEAQMPSHLHSVNPPSTASGNQVGTHYHHKAAGVTGTAASSGSAHYHATARTAKIGTGSSWQSAISGNANGEANATSTDGAHTHTVSLNAFDTDTETGNHAHSTDIAAFNSVTAGSGESHSNMPPYIVVNYIIYAGN